MSKIKRCEDRRTFADFEFVVNNGKVPGHDYKELQMTEDESQIYALLRMGKYEHTCSTIKLELSDLFILFGFSSHGLSSTRSDFYMPDGNK